MSLQEKPRTMLQALVNTATQMLGDLNRTVFRDRRSPARLVPQPKSFGSRYLPLRRVVLTDGVARTLFEEYAAHRKEARGEEETGWILLGLREPHEALVLATLPAGGQRD